MARNYELGALFDHTRREMHQGHLGSVLKVNFEQDLQVLNFIFFFFGEKSSLC
jgi:hypothetical protein